MAGQVHVTGFDDRSQMQGTATSNQDSSQAELLSGDQIVRPKTKAHPTAEECRAAAAKEGQTRRPTLFFPKQPPLHDNVFTSGFLAEAHQSLTLLLPLIKDQDERFRKISRAPKSIGERVYDLMVSITPLEAGGKSRNDVKINKLLRVIKPGYLCECCFDATSDEHLVAPLLYSVLGYHLASLPPNVVRLDAKTAKDLEEGIASQITTFASPIHKQLFSNLLLPVFHYEFYKLFLNGAPSSFLWAAMTSLHSELDRNRALSNYLFRLIMLIQLQPFPQIFHPTILTSGSTIEEHAIRLMVAIFQDHERCVLTSWNEIFGELDFYTVKSIVTNRALRSQLYWLFDVMKKRDPKVPLPSYNDILGVVDSKTDVVALNQPLPGQSSGFSHAMSEF